MQTRKTTHKAQVTVIVTYNRFFPNIKQIIQNTNKALRKTFSLEPIISFCKNKSLKQLLGGNTIKNDKNIKTSNSEYEGKRALYKSGIWSLCCLHLQKIFIRSQQNGRIFTIFYQVNCKRDFVIYLLEWKTCHVQYVGKAETDFNLKRNNHCKDFYMKDRICNRDASFIKIEQIRENTLSRETKKKFLKQMESFWTMKPKIFSIKVWIKK